MCIRDSIRRYRVKKDQKWTVDSPYGAIDITINLSKPEKDPDVYKRQLNIPFTGFQFFISCLCGFQPTYK